MSLLDSPDHGGVRWQGRPRRQRQSWFSAPLTWCYRRRPRSRRSKLAWLASGITLVLLFCLLGPKQNVPYYSNVHGGPGSVKQVNDHPPSPAPDHQDESGELAGAKAQPPAFHLLIRAKKSDTALCRTVTSAMILNYPPPTLVNFINPLSSDRPAKYDHGQASMSKSILDFLSTNTHLDDRDLVLIVNGGDVWFQLPPDILLSRYYDMVKENNEILKDRYGSVTVEHPAGTGNVVRAQRFSQTVLFAADKLCEPNGPRDAACVSVPESPLDPDVYGPKTDLDKEGFLNRPRFLSSGAVMGPVADLRAVYKRVVEKSERDLRTRRDDQALLSDVFGEQEYVRELERRRNSGWGTWVSEQIGISNPANLKDAKLPVFKDKDYEFGIGLDYTSQLFVDMRRAQPDLEWIQYDNISKLNTAQFGHMMARPIRINLPRDLENATNPFKQPVRDILNKAKPAWNITMDSLPNPIKRSWANLPLSVNVISASVPAMLHLNGDPVVRPTWWKYMWYHKWARGLLRKYMRTPAEAITVPNSVHPGGEDFWDRRGGHGGVWTDYNEWLEFGEICHRQEDDLFADGFGVWLHEDGKSGDEPVYNQFGKLIAGYGPTDRNEGW